MEHKKYHQIQTQIQEARRALQNWNDHRSEAMIELDSIFTELEEYKKEVQAEREASQATIKDLKVSLEKSDRDFHKHFEAYTNDMQELKLENENLSRRLKDALNEVESQKQAQKKMEARHLAQVAQAASETEMRLAEQQYQLKNQVNDLVAQLQMIQTEKNAISVKAEQYEKELRVIRNQMMSFLNVTKEVTAPEVSIPMVVSARAMSSDEKPKESAASPSQTGVRDQQQSRGNTPASRKSNKLQAANLIVDTMANPPTTVNDYLKRFGY